jgi:hypothetical protein
LPPPHGRATIGAVVKGWLGWILLALSLLVAVAGYRNQRAELDTEEQSRTVACDVGEACTIEPKRPYKIRTDVLRRRYEWTTSLGPVTVTCRRRFVFAGHWECVPVLGEMPE